MPEIIPHLVVCPLCNENFPDYPQIVYYRWKKNADARKIIVGTEIPEFFAHACPYCGFTFPNRQSDHFKHALSKKKIKAELMQTLRQLTHEVNFLVKYRSIQNFILIAKIFEHLNLPPSEIGLAWLHAAQATFEKEHNSELYYECLKNALKWLKISLKEEKKPTFATKEELLYLVGELSRQTKSFPESIDYFNQIRADKFRPFVKMLRKAAQLKDHHIYNYNSVSPP